MDPQFNDDDYDAINAPQFLDFSLLGINSDDEEADRFFGKIKTAKLNISCESCSHFPTCCVDAIPDSSNQLYSSLRNSQRRG